MPDEFKYHTRGYEHDSNPAAYLEKLGFQSLTSLEGGGSGAAYKHGNCFATVGGGGERLLVIGPKSELTEILKQLDKLEEEAGEPKRWVPKTTEEFRAALGLNSEP